MKVILAVVIQDDLENIPDWVRERGSFSSFNLKIIFVADGTPPILCESIKKEIPHSDLMRFETRLGTAEAVNVAMRFAINAKADYLFVYNRCLPVSVDFLPGLIKKLKSLGDRGVLFADIDLNAPKASFHPCLIAVKDIKNTGFVDPLYFEYVADVDWIHKCKASSVPVSFSPVSDFRLTLQSERIDPQPLYYKRRNQLFYLYRTGSFFYLFLIFWISFYEIILCFFTTSLKNPARARASALSLAVMDFFRGKRGQRLLEQKPSSLWRFFCRLLHIDDIRSGNENIQQRISVQVKWNLGDEVMSLPIFEVLKRRFPNFSIKARVNYPQLFLNNPHVDGYLNDPVCPGENIIDAKKEIRGISRIAHLQEFLGVGELPNPKLYLIKGEIEFIRQKWGFQKGSVHVGLTTEAKWFSRRWPRNNWLDLAEHFSRNEKIRLYVLGTDDEPLPYGINTVGQTSVREAALILSQCDLFVGSDSGLVHLALAVGTPVVGLYGPLNPYFLIQARPSFVPLWSEVPCRGCWSDNRMKHPDHCPKIEPDCMTSISSELVIKTCDSLLAARYSFFK